MSTVSPTLFVRENGEPLLFKVDNHEIKARPRQAILKALRKAGGVTTNVSSDADIILVIPGTGEANRYIKAWGDKKAVLDHEWVDLCVARGAFLGQHADWGGFSVVVDDSNGEAWVEDFVDGCSEGSLSRSPSPRAVVASVPHSGQSSIQSVLSGSEHPNVQLPASTNGAVPGLNSTGINTSVPLPAGLSNLGNSFGNPQAVMQALSAMFAQSLSNAAPYPSPSTVQDSASAQQPGMIPISSLPPYILAQLPMYWAGQSFAQMNASVSLSGIPGPTNMPSSSLEIGDPRSYQSDSSSSIGISPSARGPSRLEQRLDGTSAAPPPTPAHVMSTNSVPSPFTPPSTPLRLVSSTSVKAKRRDTIVDRPNASATSSSGDSGIGSDNSRAPVEKGNSSIGRMAAATTVLPRISSTMDRRRGEPGRIVNGTNPVLPPVPTERVMAIRGFSFTHADDLWFITSANILIAHDPRLFISGVIKRLAAETDHHSFLSWRSHYQRHREYFDEYINVSGLQKTGLGEEGEEEEQDGAEEQHGTRNGPFGDPGSTEHSIDTPPSPPQTDLVAGPGIFNKFTSEDKSYLVSYVHWKRHREPNCPISSIMEEIAGQTHHHTYASWRDYWKRNKEDLEQLVSAKDAEPADVQTATQSRIGRTINPPMRYRQSTGLKLKIGPPTPPAQGQMEGRGLEVTAEDKIYVTEFIKYKHDTDPTTSREQIFEEMAVQAPYRTRTAWGCIYYRLRELIDEEVNDLSRHRYTRVSIGGSLSVSVDDANTQVEKDKQLLIQYFRQMREKHVFRTKEQLFQEMAREAPNHNANGWGVVYYRNRSEIDAAVPGNVNKRAGQRAGLEIQYDGVQPPEPPKNIVVFVNGRNKFTQEDSDYLVDFSKWTIARSPDSRIRDIIREVAKRASHHSDASWFSNFRRHEADFLINIYGEESWQVADYYDELDAAGAKTGDNFRKRSLSTDMDEGAGSTSEEGGSSNGSSSTGIEIISNPGDVNSSEEFTSEVEVDLLDHRGSSSEVEIFEHEPLQRRHLVAYTAQDFDNVVKYLGGIDLKDVAMTNKKFWVPWATKYPAHSWQSWVEYVRNRKDKIEAALAGRTATSAGGKLPVLPALKRPQSPTPSQLPPPAKRRRMSVP